MSENGTVERADRAQTLAKFQRWADEGAKPLVTEADFLHAEAGEHDALILLRRRMRAHESSKLYELRLRKTASGWQVVGETVSPWPAADPALPDQGTRR